jgi:hypothetical protein
MECIGREYIEKLCIESVKKYFPENLQERRKKKVEKIEKVVTEKFPWHKDLVEL